MIAPEAFKVSARTNATSSFSVHVTLQYILHQLQDLLETFTSKTLATGPSITKRNLTYAQANRCEKLLLRVVAVCFTSGRRLFWSGHQLGGLDRWGIVLISRQDCGIFHHNRDLQSKLKRLPSQQHPANKTGDIGPPQNVLGLCADKSARFASGDQDLLVRIRKRK